MVVERKAPNGTDPSTFGKYADLIKSIHLAYTSEAKAAAVLVQAGRADAASDPADEARRTWELWSSQPLYADLALALQEAALAQPQATDSANLKWLSDQLQLIPPHKDGAELRALLQPTLQRIIQLEDDVVAVACVQELRRYFRWDFDTAKAYRTLVTQSRQQRKKAERTEIADVPLEGEDLGESEPPPIFLSPALAEHNGVVYVSHKMAFKSTKQPKRGRPVTETVRRPVIISSDRRRIAPRRPPEGAPEGAVTWLDEGQRLALIGGLIDAPERRWSYESIVAFLHGGEPKVTAHEVYDALMASLKRYIYHADETSYVVDVLWSMGTYFYRLWNAYPYLALHGERGAGKTTLLTWLSAVCFNAEFVVNTSEASLYRSIQAKAPTLLIDEQEGLNNSKIAREIKADLMGILKSGYKAGAKVARQDLEEKGITRYFEVYSPKALAAIELFEDVLENRAILTFMTEKPAGITLDDDGCIIEREYTEFGELRDQLYVLLMQEAQHVKQHNRHARFDGTNRFRELFRPLYVMAGLVDMSRGGDPITITALDAAASKKAEIRTERDRLSSEAMLREALRTVIAQANANPADVERGTILEDKTILTDTLQVRIAFETLFSNTEQSFFTDTWFGKQVLKQQGITHAAPRRRWRKVATGFGEYEDKQVSCYVIDPKVLAE